MMSLLTDDAIPLTWHLVSIVASVASGTAFLTWFVRDQFARQTRQFFKIISRHNREDDDRFEALNTNIRRIREHLLSGGVAAVGEMRTLPRRNYLSDDSTEDG